MQVHKKSNLDVFEKGNARGCISDLVSVMLFWNEEYVSLLAKVLSKTEESKINIIFGELQSHLNKSWKMITKKVDK